MIFEWDENKRAINRERHKLDLIDGQMLFDGRPVISYFSPRHGEQRTVTVGLIGAKFYAVVWTARAATRRG
jgi:uncharacterized DUF497 family protein